MSASINIHSVAKIELSHEYASNGGCRTIRISTMNGDYIELTLFGKTDAVAGLPKSDDYREST